MLSKTLSELVRNNIHYLKPHELKCFKQAQTHCATSIVNPSKRSGGSLCSSLSGRGATPAECSLWKT